MQSARMARLITSGDGTLIQAEPSTSGELPPHIGPINRQNSLEFLPVLPPMHVHSHPVTTGHGQFVSLLLPEHSILQICALCIPAASTLDGTYGESWPDQPRIAVPCYRWSLTAAPCPAKCINFVHEVIQSWGVQGQTPPQTFVRPEDDPKPLPKIVLAQPAGGRSPPNRANSGGPNSPPPQVLPCPSSCSCC